VNARAAAITRLSLLVACAALACALLSPAGALGQADAPPADSEPLPGIGVKGQGDKQDKGGGAALGKEIVPYELKKPKGLSVFEPIDSAIQAIPHILAQVIWAFAIYLLWLALLIFNWAFEIDLVNGAGGALGPVGQTVEGIYSSLGRSFLVAAVLVAGLWALYRGVAQRRYAQTLGGLGLSVLCVAGALWAITDPQATVGQVASWSQGASAELLSLTQEAAPRAASDGPGAPLSGKPGAGTRGAADTIFDVGVVEPAEILNGKELRQGESGLQRLGLAALAAIGTVGIGLLVGFFSLAIVLLQAVALLIFAFAPVALIAAVVPGRGHDVFATWAKRLGGALVAKALLSLLLGIVLAIGAAVLVAGNAGGGSGGVGWFTGFFLYAAFLWCVLIYYSRIFGGLPLRAAAAPASGVWGFARARYREQRSERKGEAREERRELRREERSARQTRDHGLERRRGERERLERDLTPAHVRDERELGKQRELREEEARLEHKTSPTPAERSRLEEVRAEVVSDDAYAGLKQRVDAHGLEMTSNGHPAGGFASGTGPGRAPRHDRGGGGRPSQSPMQAELARNRAQAEHHERPPLYLPAGVRSVSSSPPRVPPRIEMVEDARARVYASSADRPPPAARTPWPSGDRGGGGESRGGDSR